MKPARLVFSVTLAASLFAAGSATPSFGQAKPPTVTNPQNSATAGARQQIKDAQKLVDDASKDVAKAKDKVTKNFAGKDDVAKADENVAKAKAAKDAAAKALKKSLLSRDDYKKALADQTEAQKEIDDLEANKGDPDKLEQARQKRQDIGIAIHKMDADAEKNDAATAEAKEKFETARKEREALEDEIKEALDQDPDYAAANQKLDLAKQQLASAKQSLAQQMKSEAASKAASNKTSSSSSTGGVRSSRGGKY